MARYHEKLVSFVKVFNSFHVVLNEMAMSAFLLFLIIFSYVNGQPISIHKQVVLDPDEEGYGGASYDYFSSYTSTVLNPDAWIEQNVWCINTTAAINSITGSNDWATQFDIGFSLDSSWGFHPFDAATLSFTIAAGEVFQVILK